MNRNELKEILLNIREIEYKIPENINPFELSLNMMEYIGDLDGEFRDDLVYLTLAHFIVEDKLTKDEVKKIIDMLLSEDYLFYKIGEINDSVFKRTFSMLQLPVILYKHMEDNFLSKEEVELILDKVIEYFDKEEDLRGYVEEKGWAHGIAHGADALGQLVKCKELEYDSLKKILNLVKEKMQINNYVYVNEEDERMATALMGLFERKIINEDEIVEWIKGFSSFNKEVKFPKDLKINLNTKNFLRCLYFKIFENEEYKILANEIVDVLKEIKKNRM